MNHKKGKRKQVAPGRAFPCRNSCMGNPAAFKKRVSRGPMPPKGLTVKQRKEKGATLTQVVGDGSSRRGEDSTVNDGKLSAFSCAMSRINSVP